MKLIFTSACVALGVLPALATENANAAYGAILRVPSANVEFRPRAYTVSADGEWVANEGVGGVDAGADGKRSYFMRTNAGTKSEVLGTCQYADSSNGVTAVWTAVPGQDSRAVHLELRGTLPLEEFAAGSLSADGRKQAIPYEDTKGDVFSGVVRSLELFDSSGARRLQLSFPGDQHVSIGRSGDPKIGGRLVLCLRMSDAPKAGATYAVAFTANVPGGLRLGMDGVCKIERDDSWIPFKSYNVIRSGSAFDFSSIRPTGMPAGLDGRVVARGGHFELDSRPGVPVRFNGITLGVSAVIAEHRSLEDVREDARILADRYARAGYNTILLMNYGYGVLVGSGDCTRVNPTQMEKYDTLVAALIEKGLYLWTYLEDDRFWLQPWRSCGIDRDGNLSGMDWKSLVQVHEGVISNSMAFARSFFLHKNVYTGRSLAEEPALGWISLVGEGCLGSNTAFLEKEEAWRSAWKRFLAQKRLQDPKNWENIPESFPRSISEPTRHATAFMLFLDDCEYTFGMRMKRFIRDELKCRALVSNMNGVFYRNHIRKSRVTAYDFVDGHFYVDHPDYLGIDWKPPATVGVSSPICNALGIHGPWMDREFEKPFVVTEVNYCPPNPCRGIAGLMLGAQAAYQDWAALWRFATCHDPESIRHPECETMESFNMMGDPLFRISQFATASLFLRKDMGVGKRAFAREIPDSVFAGPVDGAPDENVWHWLNWTAWFGRVGSWSGHPKGCLPEGVERLCLYPDDYYKKDLAAVSRTVAGTSDLGSSFVAADGAARLDRESGSLMLTTEMTSGGFSSKGEIVSGPLRVNGIERPTTVWVSSLDGKPIEQSKHLLVAHLVDCVNTGITFSDDTRRILLDWGKAPQLVKKSAVNVSVRQMNERWSVWALHEDGTRRYKVPSRMSGDCLVFDATTDGKDGWAVLAYELESL